MITQSERPVWCPMCGSQALSLVYPDVVIADPLSGPLRLRSLWDCPDCHAFWSRLPPSIRADDYYRNKPEADHLPFEGTRARFARVQLAVERAVGRDNYRLLDVGCATGAHFDAYGDRVQKFGIEPAASAIESLRRRGVTWLGPSIESAPVGSFDVVTSLDVLEHLEEPRPFLDTLDRCLAPHGVVAIVTGNIDSLSARCGGRRWLYYALPEHCSFFSPLTLRRYWVDERGYEPLTATWIANKDIDATYVRGFLVGLAREAVLRMMPPHRVRSLERAGRGRFPFFCDNMLLTFRKNGTSSQNSAADVKCPPAGTA